MSIATKLEKLTTDITSAYTSIDNKGGTIPSDKNTDNLHTAIDSIEVIEQATAEGESLSLTNTKAMPYNDYVVEGKSEQATRSGKNLYNIFDINNVSGLTVNNDGWATATINNSSGASLIILNLKVPTTNLINVSTNYALFLEIETVSGQGFLCLNETSVKSQFQTERTLSLSTLTANSVNKYIMTTRNNFENSTNMFWSYLYAEAGKSCSIKYRLSVLADTSITADDFVYELYGASPSLDYPSEIHSVADDVNLLNLENIENHSVNSYYYENIGTNFQLKAGETYTLSFDAESDITPFDVGIGCGSSGNYQSDILLGNGFQNGRISITFTPQNSNFTYGNYLAVRFVKYNYSTSYTYSARNIKLQKGTEATPYSPYNQGTVTIKQRGKNEINLNRTLGTPSNASYDASSKRLFNYNNYIIGITSNNYYLTSKISSYNVQNNTIKVEVNGSGYGVGFPIKLKPNTSYILSYDTDLEANQNSGIGFYKSDGTYISNINSLLTNNYINFTTPSNCDFAVIIFRPPVNTELTYRNIQLEEGSTATVYEPYQTPHDYTIQTEPLRSLPNGVKDTIEDDGIHRRVGRVVLDGSESGWYKQDNTSYSEDYLRFTIGITDKKNAINPNSQKDNILSDKFTNKILDNNATRQSNSITGQYSTNLINIFIAQSIIIGNDVNAFKTWLSTHNTEILYSLATEVIEPLTQNQATTMLDIIKTGSYEGTTNIYTDEDVKPTMKAGHYKKG